MRLIFPPHRERLHVRGLFLREKTFRLDRSRNKLGVAPCRWGERFSTFLLRRIEKKPSESASFSATTELTLMNTKRCNESYTDATIEDAWINPHDCISRARVHRVEKNFFVNNSFRFIFLRSVSFVNKKSSWSQRGMLWRGCVCTTTKAAADVNYDVTKKREVKLISIKVSRRAMKSAKNLSWDEIFLFASRFSARVSERRNIKPAGMRSCLMIIYDQICAFKS